MRMHIRNKMRWYPRWRSIGGIIYLQVGGHAVKPICEQGILFNKSGVGTPVSLFFDLVVYVGDDADVVGIPNKVSILSRTVNLELVKAFDIQQWSHVHSLRVDTVVRTA